MPLRRAFLTSPTLFGPCRPPGSPPRPAPRVPPPRHGVQPPVLAGELPQQVPRAEQRREYLLHNNTSAGQCDNVLNVATMQQCDNATTYSGFRPSVSRWSLNTFLRPKKVILGLKQCQIVAASVACAQLRTMKPIWFSQL